MILWSHILKPIDWQKYQKLYNNDRKFHQFKILNSYYVAELNINPLRPQDWVYQAMSSIISIIETGDTTTASNTVLFWNGGKSKLGIFLGSIDNVATFYLSLGY